MTEVEQKPPSDFAKVMGSLIVSAVFIALIAFVPAAAQFVLIELAAFVFITWMIWQPRQVKTMTREIASATLDSLDSTEEFEEPEEEEPEEEDSLKECQMCGCDLESYDHPILCGDCKAKVTHFAPKLGYYHQED